MEHHETIDTIVSTTFSVMVSAIAKILLYLLCVLVVAVFVSPLAYWLVQWLAGQGVLTGLAGHPFHRYFSRTVQVAAFVFLIPLLFWLGIRSTREFGLEPNRHRLRDLVAGLIIAVIPVVILAGFYLGFDVYRVKKDLAASGLLRIVLTAGFVAMVEEFLFRGVILGLTVKAIGRTGGLLLVSAVFAGVHFLKSAKEPLPVVHWYSGFQELQAVFGGFPGLALFLYGYLSLFVAGLILGSAALRTRSLFLPIGLHAGWILTQQGLQWLAKFRGKPVEEYLPWVGPNLVSGAVPTGLAPLLALVLTGVAVLFYLRHERAARLAGNS